MKLKKYLAIILSAAMACSVMCKSVSAEEALQVIQVEISPAYEIAQDAKSFLTISSGTATCESKCNGLSETVKITAVQTLQKYWGLWIWEDVKDGGGIPSSFETTVDLGVDKFVSVIIKSNSSSNASSRFTIKGVEHEIYIN